MSGTEGADTSAPRRGRRLGQIAAWPLLLLATAIVVLSPGLVRGPSLDAAVFTEVGVQLRHGAVLYRDVWDHKPPLLYLLEALFQTGLPFLSAWLTSWWLSVLALVASGLLAERLVRMQGSTAPARQIGLLVVILSGSFWFALGGGLTETLATPLAGAGILLLLRARDRAGPYLLAGLLLGAAALTSLQLLPALLALVTFWEGRPRWRVLLLLAAGVGVAIGGMATWLALTGALGSAYDPLVVYSAAYATINRDDWGRMLPNLAFVPFVLAAIVVPLFFVSPRTLFARIRHIPLVRGCAAWAAGEVLLVILQGRIELHYVIPLILPLSVLTSGSFATPDHAPRLWRTLANGKRLAFVGAIECSLLIVAWGTFLGFLTNHRSAEDQVVDWLATNTVPSARIFVWGNEPSLYLEAQPTPASKYLYAFPLMTPGYSSPQQIAEMVTAFTANPPAAIIDASWGASTSNLSIVPLLVPHRVDVGDGRTADIIDGLRQFVANDYRLDVVVAGWPIYVYKG